MSKARFRSLILLYVALIVASPLAMLIPDGYSKEFADAMENEPMPWPLEDPWMTLATALPFAALAFAGGLGLYTFKRWGRTLSLYSTAIGLFVWPFFGPTLYSGIEAALVEASTLLWGAILALAYYSIISAEFSANKSMQPTCADARG